jgi:hypothetical protein
MIFVAGIDIAPFQKIEQVLFLRRIIRKDVFQFFGEPLGITFELIQVMGLGLVTGFYQDDRIVGALRGLMQVKSPLL